MPKRTTKSPRSVKKRAVTPRRSKAAAKPAVVRRVTQKNSTRPKSSSRRSPVRSRSGLSFPPYITGGSLSDLDDICAGVHGLGSQFVGTGGPSCIKNRDKVKNERRGLKTATQRALLQSAEITNLMTLVEEKYGTMASVMDERHSRATGIVKAGLGAQMKTFEACTVSTMRLAGSLLFRMKYCAEGKDTSRTVREGCFDLTHLGNMEKKAVEVITVLTDYLSILQFFRVAFSRTLGEKFQWLGKQAVRGAKYVATKGFQLVRMVTALAWRHSKFLVIALAVQVAIPALIGTYIRNTSVLTRTANELCTVTRVLTEMLDKPAILIGMLTVFLQMKDFFPGSIWLQDKINSQAAALFFKRAPRGTKEIEKAVQTVRNTHIGNIVTGLAQLPTSAQIAKATALAKKKVSEDIQAFDAKKAGLPHTVRNVATLATYAMLRTMPVLGYGTRGLALVNKYLCDAVQSGTDITQRLWQGVRAKFNLQNDADFDSILLNTNVTSYVHLIVRSADNAAILEKAAILFTQQFAHQNTPRRGDKAWSLRGPPKRHADPLQTELAQTKSFSSLIREAYTRIFDSSNLRGVQEKKLKSLKARQDKASETVRVLFLVMCIVAFAIHIAASLLMHNSKTMDEFVRGIEESDDTDSHKYVRTFGKSVSAVRSAHLELVACLTDPSQCFVD